VGRIRKLDTQLISALVRLKPSKSRRRSARERERERAKVKAKVKVKVKVKVMAKVTLIQVLRFAPELRSYCMCFELEDFVGSFRY